VHSRERAEFHRILRRVRQILASIAVCVRSPGGSFICMLYDNWLPACTRGIPRVITPCALRHHPRHREYFLAPPKEVREHLAPRIFPYTGATAVTSDFGTILGLCYDEARCRALVQAPRLVCIRPRPFLENFGQASFESKSWTLQ